MSKQRHAPEKAQGRNAGRIKLLHAEDVATDAELVQRELRRAGLVIEPRVVDTPEDFQREIETFQPDVIVADYAMPKFHGLDALAIARKCCPGTPFIFCSGTLGEEHAIRALKDGAADYVVKQNLLRLPTAVERALAEARERAVRQRAEADLQAARERLNTIVDAAPVAILGLDLDGRVTSWSAGAYRLFGWSAGEAIGRVCPTVPGHGLEDFKAMIRATVQEGPQAGLVRYQQKKNGDQIHANITSAPLRDAANGAIGIMLILEDITERTEQRRRIARLSRIREVISSVNAALLRMRELEPLFDEVCRIAVEEGGFQSAWMGALNRDGQEVRTVTSAGNAPDVINTVRISAWENDEAGRGIVGRSIRTRQVAVWNDVATDPGVSFREEFLQHGARSMASFPLIAEDKVLGVLALSSTEKHFFDQEEIRLLREVTGNIGFALDMIAKQKQVNYLANYDVLTGLANRTLFHERLSQALQSAPPGGKLALIVFDLERFKLINDTLGRQGGDELLRQVAGRLRGLAPSGSIPARLGGDRFALMFPAVKDASDVMRVLNGGATRFLGKPFLVEGRELHVLTKAGVALFPADGADADTLFRNAEAALKQAKQSGDSYLFYAPQINARVAEQLGLENRLHKAIGQRQFVLHYQPKVDLQTRRILGLEALIRWNDPDQGLVAPGIFLPTLEETGMILPVGLWVMEEAARTWQGWTERGLTPPRIAVNVSATQVRQSGWVAEVERTVALFGGGACGLDLEITESILMDDVEAAIAKLKAIQALGMTISLDDFGTGYSSLSYLRRLPINALKIDGSFIGGMPGDAGKTSLVSGIITLAHSLRLQVIAEGVETEAQAKLLGRLRCDQIQGWLISEAVPADQMEALLGAR